ncbi:MAG: hypothetical protein H8E13_06265 [Actinobacteria bacterium]|nr:hypothetical protein [Actinomycetota bacterium]
MKKYSNIDKKTLTKFLNLIDKGIDIDLCLSKFPNDYDNLKEYAAIINSLKNLKNIHADKDFEEKSLKDIYLQAKLENINNKKY